MKFRYLNDKGELIYSGDDLSAFFKDAPKICDRWIGIMDSKGVPIFENDIVLDKYFDHLIRPQVVSMSVYDDIGWALFGHIPDPKKYEDALAKEFKGIKLYEGSFLSYLFRHNYEVIGNIHQHVERINISSNSG